MEVEIGKTVLPSHYKGTRRYVIHPCDFIKQADSHRIPQISWQWIRSINPEQDKYMLAEAPVHLPHGAIVTGFKVFWYRNDALATGSAALGRLKLNDGTYGWMATAGSDSSAGHHEVEDTTIDYPTIDNVNYAYFAHISLYANDAVGDVYLKGILITYSIDSPLP